MKRFAFLSCCLLFVGSLFANNNPEKDSLISKNEIPLSYTELTLEWIEDSIQFAYMRNDQLFAQEWHTFEHPYFWRSIMALSKDSCVLNVGDTREIIRFFSKDEWNSISKEEQKNYRDSVRLAKGLDSNARIFLTTGKSDFYRYDGILSSITQGVLDFQRYNVDPWYAQAILMIESPNKLARSSAGAYGAFQLMPGVARKFGLTVNKNVDERRDFDKSARAASRLISEICIPEAKIILANQNLQYNETDLWFRLFVMHIYHAGAYNVSGVVNKIGKVASGTELIQKMWITSAGKFGNASQNYSQVALAAMMILEDMVCENNKLLVKTE